MNFCERENIWYLILHNIYFQASDNFSRCFISDVSTTWNDTYEEVNIPEWHATLKATSPNSRIRQVRERVLGSLLKSQPASTPHLKVYFPAWPSPDCWRRPMISCFSSTPAYCWPRASRRCRIWATDRFFKGLISCQGWRVISHMADSNEKTHHYSPVEHYKYVFLWV